MVPGFYELLGVERTATPEEIRLAHQRQLAGLVRRLKAAHRASADSGALEAQERALKEAVDVLCDPARRRRYDAFRRAVETGLPQDAEGLWEAARGALVDPAAGAALETVRALTDLPFGPPLPGMEFSARVEPEPPPRPERAEVPRHEPVRAEPARAPEPAVVVAADLASDEVFFDEEEAWDLYPVDEDDVSEPEPIAKRPAPVAKVAAPAAAPRDPIAALVERYGHDGRFLRAVRELRGLSLDDLARTTRISQRYLEALEENGYDRLPAGTFVRGYVKTVARLLGLDEATVGEGYMALFNHHRG